MIVVEVKLLTKLISILGDQRMEAGVGIEPA